jgi:hypothetical protein
VVPSSSIKWTLATLEGRIIARKATWVFASQEK